MRTDGHQVDVRGGGGEAGGARAVAEDGGCWVDRRHGGLDAGSGGIWGDAGRCGEISHGGLDAGLKAAQ